VLTDLFAAASHHDEPAERHIHARRHASAVVREAACALSGHDYLQHAEHGRMFLRCTDCGHETPGWSVDVHRQSPREDSLVPAK
jgi:hypothetical protein